jgi:hypothetical protein
MYQKARENGDEDEVRRRGGYPEGLFWILWAAEDRGWFWKFHADMRSALGRTGLLAVTVGQTLALYEPFVERTTQLTRIEGTLKELAYTARRLALLPWDDEAGVAQAIARAMRDRTAEVGTLQMAMTEESAASRGNDAIVPKTPI